MNNLLTTGCAALCLAYAAVTHAQAPNVLFVLDGSGSMWGQVDNQPKISIAKEVMTNLINDLPDSVRPGLQVYGHRRKGDCNDIEIMTPVGQGDKQTLVKQIQSIKPKGKTPITKSLQIAANQLRASEDETTVVLINDGRETCDADPCALVRELRDSGVKVQVHVVGFDVSKEEKEQLLCIAKEGGGKYFSADNSSQLNEALAVVKEEVIQQAHVESQKPTPLGQVDLIRLFSGNSFKGFAETSDGKKLYSFSGYAEIGGRIYAHVPEWTPSYDNSIVWSIEKNMFCQKSKKDNKFCVQVFKDKDEYFYNYDSVTVRWKMFEGDAFNLAPSTTASQDPTILWEDHFERSELGDAYTRENPDDNHFAIDEGKVVILSHYQYKNKIILNKPISGNFVASVKISTEGGSYNLARLFYNFHNGEGNYIVLGIGQGGNGSLNINFGKEKNGNHTHIDGRAAESNELYLQLEKRGVRYTARTSTDGKDWADLGTTLFLNKNDGYLGFGIKAWDKKGKEVIAEFDDFIIRKLD